MRLSLLLVSLLAHESLGSPCACATGTVNVRSGAGTSHSILGTLAVGECHPDKGGRQQTGGYEWANLDYNGQDAWVADQWLNFEACACSGCQCACATGTVNVRSGAGTSHSILGTLAVGECHPDEGGRQHAGGYEWANLDYNGQDAWVADQWLNFKPCAGTGCPEIISRAEWGARAPTEALDNLASGEPHYVFIHHGASGGCYTKAECISKMKSYQNYHMDVNGWSDIGYSFVVGEDGNVYEARGWDKVGAHTVNYNDKGIGICVIGNFQDHVPNDAALNAVQSLINCGISTNKIPSYYVLKGHRDVSQTACPGQKLYDLVQSWPHYQN